MRPLALFALTFIIELSSSLAAPTNYFDLDPRRFQFLAAHNLQVDAINHDLLSAAIVRETNERRRQNGLPALKYSPKATQASKIQADIMRARGSISHENPENARYRTLELRTKSVGMNYRLIAENVATAFPLQYKSGSVFYPQRIQRGTIFTSTPFGAPIPPHTYATFAKALVDAWMNSKGHRENILLKDAQYLGADCAPGPVKDGEMQLFYCAQVFFTPADPKSAP